MNPAPRLPEHPELGDIRFIRRLSGGGGWNETWLAARGAERLVVRLDTPAVRALGLNRTAEEAVLRSIQRAGLGPELIYSDIRRGVLVTRQLPGRACAADDMRKPRLLRKVGELLRRLHETAGPPPGLAPLDLSRAVDHYASLVGSAWARRTAREADQSLKAAACHKRKSVLCHNDPVAQNVFRGPCLRLIDWEFASLGDPLFDLAVIAGHHGIDAGRVRTLLAAARGRVYRSDWRSLTHLVNGYGRLRPLWEAAVRAVIGRSSRTAQNPG